jgi:hypothetical protein
MTKIQYSSTKIQTNYKFKIPMTETGKYVYSDPSLCFEIVFWVIGYYLLFVICDL